MNFQETKLSVWAENISPSPTLAITAKAKALKAAGEDICGFGAGEPDFDTPDFIKEACIEALRAGQTKYLAAAGLPDLREALAEKYANENGIPGVTAENVIVSPGGKYACALGMQAVCGPGDEIIIPTPYWVSYTEMAKLVGAVPVIVSAPDSAGFKITPAQFEAAITERTKLLVLNSPSNPTGVVYSREELEAIMEVAVRRGVLVMSDEIYEYLLYDNVTFHSPASFSEEAAAKCITVSGFSKTFSMTGWRLGTLVAPAKIARAVAGIQSHTTSNATTFAQFGALAALRQPDKAKAALDMMLEAFDRRRLYMLDALQKAPGVACQRAQGAFYLFPNISSFGLTSSEFSDRLLEEEKVAVVPGIAFGDDACVRLSYAASDDIIGKGLARMKNFCERLAS